MKIMIVDDDPQTSRSIRSMVIPLGHKVLTFEDNEEAARQSETQKFDVVFVGLRTPGLEGLEVTRRIRNSELNRETVLVMLSDTDDIGTWRKAFGEGATFILPKPVSSARIIPMLKAMEHPSWKAKSHADSSPRFTEVATTEKAGSGRKMHAARLPLFTEVTCKWGERQFSLRSMNISETGILLQPGIDVENGEEVSLQFRIPETRSDLNLCARIVRKDGAERVGLDFIDLAPEDKNAIQIYVMGRLESREPSRAAPRTKPRRILDRYP